MVCVLVPGAAVPVLLCVGCLFLCISDWMRWIESGRDRESEVSKLHINCFPLYRMRPAAILDRRRVRARETRFNDIRKYWLQKVKEQKKTQNDYAVPLTVCFSSTTTHCRFSSRLPYCILFKINSFYNINHCACVRAYVVLCSAFDRCYSKDVKIHRHVSEVVFFPSRFGCRCCCCCWWSSKVRKINVSTTIAHNMMLSCSNHLLASTCTASGEHLRANMHEVR